MTNKEVLKIVLNNHMGNFENWYTCWFYLFNDKVLVRHIMNKEFKEGRYFIDIFGSVQFFVVSNEDILNIIMTFDPEYSSIEYEYDFLDVKNQDSKPLKYFNESKVIKF